MFIHVHYLMWMLEGHMEVKLSEDEEFTLYYTISQLPELLIQLHWITSWTEISAGEINDKQISSSVLATNDCFVVEATSYSQGS